MSVHTSLYIVQAACISLGLQPHQKAEWYLFGLTYFCDTVTLSGFAKCNQWHPMRWNEKTDALWRLCACWKRHLKKKKRNVNYTRQKVDWYWRRAKSKKYGKWQVYNNFLTVNDLIMDRIKEWSPYEHFSIKEFQLSSFLPASLLYKSLLAFVLSLQFSAE